MAELLANRDGGKTDEHGLTRFVSNLLTGAVISTGWKVSQRGAGPNMSVDIATGDAKIDSGSGYGYLAWSDAIKNMAITTADATNPRNDIVVAYIDKSVVSSTNPNNPNALKFLVVAGTPAGSPSDPSDSAIQTAVGAGNPYIKLARVLVGAGATSITDSVITDLRTLVSGNFNIGGSDGWISADEVWTYFANNGGREYQFKISGDKTGKYSAGMNVKITRSTSPPTQCTDLEASSSQYANDTTPANLNFTDDFTAEAMVKLESYVTGTVIARLDATSANGWELRVDGNGRIQILGFNGGAANVRYCTSHRAIPLNTWVHIAATLDMSGNTGTIYIDGELVASFMTSGGTSPTALVQAGDLAIGRQGSSATLYFDGKIADVRIWSVVRTQTEIRNNMNQQLVGNETNLVGYWKLNGNFNDSHANANHMTGQGGAVATNADNPMKLIEYGKILEASYSSPDTTVRIYTGRRHNLPNMTLGSPAYSTQRTPYGLPLDLASPKIVKQILRFLSFSHTNNNVDTDIDGLSIRLYVPEGAAVKFKFEAPYMTQTGAGGTGMRGKIKEGSETYGHGVLSNVNSSYAMHMPIQTPALYPTAGEHTFKVAVVQETAGTQTVVSGTAPYDPIFFEVEMEL